MPSSHLRAFIAIPLPHTVNRAINQHTRTIYNHFSITDNDRWLPQSNRHLTLLFLGNVERNQLQQLWQACRTIHLPRFDLQCQAIARFPDARSSIVAATLATTPSLQRLQQAIADHCSAHGLGHDSHQRFRPHITLCRLKRGGHPATEPLVLSPPITLPVDAFTLYESRTEPNQAIYEALDHIPLQDDASKPIT